MPTGWHDYRWAQTLRYAGKELGYEVVYVGTATDGPAISTLRKMVGSEGISLAGKTTINQLADLIALSYMVVTLSRQFPPSDIARETRLATSLSEVDHLGFQAQ